MLDFAVIAKESSELSISIPLGEDVAGFEPGAQLALQEFLEARFDRQRELTANWMIRCWRNLYVLEGALQTGEILLSSEEAEELINVAAAFEDSADELAKWTARAVKSFRKQAQAAKRHSKETFEYISKYATRVEAATNRDLDAALDIADHHRAISRAYAPNNSSTEEFESVSGLISYLKAS